MLLNKIKSLFDIHRQKEVLRKERDFSKRAEWLAKKHAEILETRSNEVNLLANISAEKLKNPLDDIMTSVSFLKHHNSSLSPVMLEKMDRIITETTQIKTLLSSYQQYAETALEQHQYTLVSLETVLENAIKNAEEDITKNHVTLAYSHEAFKDCPKLRGDAEQLSAVFQQLITNAIKYRKDSVLPHLNIELEVSEGVCLCAIQDNGVGIPAKKLEPIFWSIKPSSIHFPNHKEGVGLAICRKIIEQHGGKIWAYSLPDRGSTFYLALPCFKA